MKGHDDEVGAWNQNGRMKMVMNVMDWYLG